MTGSWRVLAALALAGSLWLGGCKKHKASTVPPQAGAPSITAPAPQPAAPAAPKETVPAASAPATPPPSPPESAPAPKPKPRRHAAKKPAAPAAVPAAPAPAAETKPPAVVPEGSAPSSSGQLTSNLPPEEAAQAREKTAQLLVSTETDLKGLTRKLSADEQAMLEQTRSYLAQSHAALADGDVLRAYNLAVKARLLANALLKV